VVLEDAFSLFLALSDREFLTEKSLLDYLQAKLTEMDDEESGGELRRSCCLFFCPFIHNSSDDI